MADSLHSNILEIEEDPTVTRQVTSVESTTQRSRSEVAPRRSLSCYGSAPEEFWSQLSSRDVQDQSCDLVETLSEDTSPLEVRLLNPFDIFLLRKIAEGGQGDVFFATCEKFSTPLVVKRLKYKLKRGQEDLVKLQKRMDKVMKTSRRSSSAVCKVMGVGMDAVGNACIVMERMGGDLRNLIDHGVRCVGDGRMPYVDGQMPFDYSDTIKMLIDISQGVQDLHSCGLIHRDLKAANILVTPLPLDSHLGEVLIESVELEQDLESFYFYARIGDYDSSDDIVGTAFWRPPEVLQSLKDRTEPIKWSFAGDVYSFGMLCYELLTGRIPFEKHLKDLPEAYDVVLSGQRPELPPHVNLKMTELLNSCWQMEPEKRPGWTEIIESLSKELESHPPPGQGPGFYRRMKVGNPKAENQTTVIASSSSSSASPVSPGMQASSSRMESLPNSEYQTPGSFSSTGLLKMQQRGKGPVKSQALPIIWEEDYNFAEWKKTLIWRAVLQGYDIPNDEAALQALIPRGGARALKDIAGVEVDAESRFREAGAAWCAVMESWVQLTPAPSEVWQAIQPPFTADYGVRILSWKQTWEVREVLRAWRKESPVEFKAWMEACRQNTVMKTWRAAYSEIVNLQKRVRKIKISPAFKVGSGWKADMDLKLLKDFNSLVVTKKDDVFERAENVRAMFREAEMSLPFFPTKLNS